jgi:cytochrome c biogenesis protein CcmG/thiol:disulfide interchange protein DsbE
MNRPLLIPLALFGVLVAFLAVGLTRNPREVPSPLIGKPVPAFAAPILHAPQTRLAAQDMLGQVWLLNVWASWCVACQQEHPLLMAFAQQKAIPLVGLDYKDKSGDAVAWLVRHGNPYDVVVVDEDGRIGIDFGVYGVPETFLIDQKGSIRFKHIGPLTPEVLRDRILPLVRELQP